MRDVDVGLANWLSCERVVLRSLRNKSTVEAVCDLKKGLLVFGNGRTALGLSRPGLCTIWILSHSPSLSLSLRLSLSFLRACLSQELSHVRFHHCDRIVKKY